ncbi:hypothetical protein [Flavobacterium sp. LHD-85]|uniref:hypothetical protein n=1 Tax=Flavobacterium sp. LHD-85 TaxID=3071410 RepID=UPI0027DF08EB|nr:hypothetical protein [Flavobacterium sp. LHD-85]MDQ6528084.1 hypothetical protein [Flavobacterium sp. LHD-85]
MKKLKGREVNLCSILILCVLFFNCQKNGQLQQRKGRNSTIQNEHLSKEVFFKCTTAKDTIFKNGDYIRFIPVNKSYGIEIKMNGIVDTLDNYLFDCDSYNGMIPKLLFKTDYIALGQGSSTNYRYLIICNLNNELGKIDVSKFETEIVENPEKEILFFKRNHDVFLFNKKSRKLFFAKLPSKFYNLKVQKFELYKSKAIIIFEQGDSLTYKLNEFGNTSN